MISFKQFVSKLNEDDNSSPSNWNDSDNPNTVHVFVTQPPGNRLFTEGHKRDLMDTAKRLSDSLRNSPSMIHIGVPRAKGGDGDYNQYEINDVAKFHHNKVFGEDNPDAVLTPGSNMGGDVAQKAVQAAKERHPGKRVVLHLITGHDQWKPMDGYGQKMLNQKVPEFADPSMKIDEVHTHVPEHNERMQVDYTDSKGVPQSVTTSGTNLRAAARSGDRERASAILGYNGKHLDSILEKAATQERPSDKKAKAKKS